MMSTETDAPKPASRLRKAAFAVVAIVGVWMLGDLAYSTVIATRYRAWEAAVQRDDSGVRVGCRDFYAGRGTTALLLLHGINDSPACYREMADSLAAKGYACRVMRLPGFAERLENYAKSNRQQWVDSVRSELAALRESHQTVIIVAHSLGGAIAIRVLRENPEAADAAVLLAPALEVANDRSPVLSPAIWNAIANRLLVFTWATESTFGLDAKVADDESYPYRSPFTPRTIFDETFALIEENRGRAEAFTTPLLMVLSPDDVVIDVPAAKAFYDDSAAEPKELMEIPDTGHSMTVDHNWPMLVERIDRFAASVAAGTPAAKESE